MFRDQNRNVMKKAKAKAALQPEVASSARATGADTTTPAELLLHQDTMSQPSLALIHNLAPTIDERATGWFFSNYVIGIDGPARASWVQEIDGHLLTSMKAVGLAGFSHTAHAPDLLIESKKLYVAAIRRTNNALRSPADVAKDSTLLAIMLLSIFETMTGGGQRSLTAWASHINGAAALLKLRGPEQLNTQLGIRLFMQITSSLVTSCLQHDIPLPDHVLELQVEASRHVDCDDLGWRFLEIMILFTDFHQRVKHGSISDPNFVLSRASELDGILMSTFFDLPPKWQYETLYTDADRELVFAGYYHMYYDFLGAQIWNGMRTIRILLNQMILKVLRAGHAHLPPLSSSPDCAKLSQRSTEILYQMQSDIIASVPQHIGYSPKSHGMPLSFCNGLSTQEGTWSHFDNGRHDVTPLNQTTSASLPLIRLFGGYLLPWPLYMVGIMGVSSQPVQKWAIKTLRMVGQTMGVEQAMILAEKLEKRPILQGNSIGTP